MKISTSTGLPSGVASLRRDQLTGRIRVVCPPGFSIAHRGTTLAVAADTPIFLDELSGFEHRPDAQQPYMQGWRGSGFAVRFKYLLPLARTLTPHHFLVELLAPRAAATLAPMCSLPTPWPCADTSPLTCHACSPPLYRSHCQWRGCRRRLQFNHCVHEVGTKGVPRCGLLRVVLSVPGFVVLDTLLGSVLLCCGDCCCDIECLTPALPYRCAQAAASTGCLTLCPPHPEPPGLLSQHLGEQCTCSDCRTGKSVLQQLGANSRTLQWHIPTLLKTRLFCLHPWTRKPFSARWALTRRAACRRPIGAPLHARSTGTRCTALDPVTFHFWDLWQICSRILVVRLKGDLHRRTVIYEGLGPHFQSLSFSKCSRPPTSANDATHITHTSHESTYAHYSPPEGTNHSAGDTSALPHRMQGSPGPKSGRCSSFTCCRPLSSLGLLLIHIQATRATTTSDARVPLASQVSGEAGRCTPAPRQAPAKPLGTQDATCRSPLPSLQRQRIVKRSLQRVHRRILRTGGAWYKGKWYNQDTASALTNALHDVPNSANSKPQTAHPTAQASAQHKPSPRHLQVYTWNVGGLGGGLYDEILYYIHQHPVDVLMIQETKWRFTSSWDTHQYIFVHSGSQEPDFKQGGLLTVVAKRLLDPGTLRYVDVIPGRLLRIQFHRHSQPCDLLNFYQHTWRATDHVRRLRHQALDQLTRTINMIPKRSLMIIGGDFNASCISSSPHVGSHVLARSQTWATDQEDLQALILGLDLCALNTFQSTHPLHTYMWGAQRSHIDFLLIRREMADSLSKQSYAMHDHPLGAWRGGARHFLVFAQVPTHWRPWSGQTRATSSPVVDRHAIADALAGKADPRIQAFRQDLQLALSGSPADVSDLHDTVYSLAVQHFPKKAPIRGPRPWQDGTLQQYASLMWGHLRALRRWAARPGSSASAQALFRCWRHSVQYFRMHRRAQQQGRDLRKQRRISLLTEADQALRHGHSRLFYQLIDKLAPKGRFRKFQLSKGGNILSPSEELEVMRKHFVQVFNSDDPAGPAQVATPSADAPFRVDCHELQAFLDKLPARKAGAPATAPGAVWRMCSDMVAPLLSDLLNRRWCASPLSPPEPWAKATLSLLLKPHKTGSSPKDFRPIGLLDALGKATISMLLSKLRSDLELYIRTSPQFAYITGRSTSDALRRVFLHNSEARTLRSSNSRDPHFKRAGGKPAALRGALQVCLDLTSAFDFVPRHLIAEALQEAGITGAPAELLLTWLHNCSYDLFVEGQCAHIYTNRGVKQGCPASPLLFAAFMTLITRRLSTRLSSEWIAQHLTMFADDFHVGKCFHGFHELETLSAQIGFIITTLRKHGMSVHATKAQAILTMDGTQRSTALQKLTRNTDDGRFFRVYTRLGDEFLPLVRKVDYLGAVTTYDSCATATLRRRTLLAKAAHSRLRSVLHAYRTLTVTHRVRLWRATVWPCLAYGLEICGLTVEHHAQIQTLVMRHLRGIARSPAHLTHESDVAIAQRLQVPLPRVALRRTFESAFGRQEPDDPFVLSFEHPWNQHLAHCLADLSAAPLPTPSTSMQLPVYAPEVDTAMPPTTSPPPPEPDAEVHDVAFLPRQNAEEPTDLLERPSPSLPMASLEVPGPALTVVTGPFACPRCQKSCDTRKILKLHMSRVHQVKTPPHPFDRAIHSVRGMPTCALCLHSFTRWEVLEKHISSWSCPAMPLPPSHTANQDLPDVSSSVPRPSPAVTVPVPRDAPPPVIPQAVPPSLSAQASPHSGTPVSAPEPTTIASPRASPKAVTSGSLYPSDAAPFSAEVATASDPLPERVQQILKAGGLPALLRNVITRELLHHCGICGQWLASPTALKNHYRSLHADLFDRLAERVDKQVMRHGIALNPCLYCNTAHRHPRQHIPHCVSLWQSCFLHALSENGSPAGTPELSGGSRGVGTAPELLRGRAGQQEEHGRTVVSRAERPGSKDRTRSRSPRGSGQRLSGQRGQASSEWPRQEPTPSRQSKLLEWLHGGIRGCRTSASTGESSGATRRFDKHPAQVHRMGVVGSLRRGLSAPSACRAGTQMVRGCQRSGDPAQSSELASDLTLGSLDLSQGQTQRTHSGPGGFRSEELMGGHVRELELSEVGCPSSDAHSGHIEATAQHSAGSREPGNPPSGHQRRHLDSLHSHSGDSCGHAGQDHLQCGHQSTSAGLRYPVPGIGSPPGLSSVPNHRGPVQAGRVQSSSADSSDRAADWMRQVILTNRTNVCYLNSIALCVAWTILRTPSLQPLLCQHGRLALAVLLEATRPVNLLQSPPWQRMLHSWAQPTRQHDAAELLLHLIPLLGPQVFAGVWESRRQEPNHVRILDGGECAAAISLDLPARNGNTSLQQLVNSWHAQHTIQALVIPPPILILRLSRFLATRRGFRKHTGCISWRASVHIPVFTDATLQSQVIEYQILAAVCHRGQHATSGHYTTVLHQHPQAWHCDDNIKPKPWPPDPDEPLQFSSPQVYLLICRRRGAAN